MNDISERYRAAKLDRAAKIRTGLTVLGLVCLLVLILVVHQLVAGLVFLAAPILLFPAVAYACAPIGYALSEQALRIERNTFWTVTIPLSQITGCRPVARGELARAIRVYGTGGLFGWAGRYQSRRLGTFSMHATNLDQLILIQRRRRKAILISPADTGAFLNGLRRQYETIVVPPQPHRVAGAPPRPMH